MERSRLRAVLAISTIVDGLLAGASVDQSVEQLPARHRIGVRAYHAYTQASRMANGRFWLIPLGVAAPTLTFESQRLHFSSRPRRITALPSVAVSCVAAASQTRSE